MNDKNKIELNKLIKIKDKNIQIKIIQNIYFLINKWITIQIL